MFMMGLVIREKSSVWTPIYKPFIIYLPLGTFNFYLGIWFIRLKLGLDQVFYHSSVENAEKSVSPEQLVKPFGWGKNEASIQQDPQ